MTTVNPVSSQNPETSRKPFNEFHFKVLNSFNLDEFKKFTNFPQLLAETIKKTLGSAPDRFSFESRIGHHFRRSISNEDKWRLGLFNGLKLTDEFYGSDTAKRIFKKSYGVRSCAVRVVRLPAESQSSADLEERLELSSDVDEENVAAKIDLTMSDESSPNIIDPRNMRVKYPRKQTQPKKSSPISGIDTYISPAKSVERIPMPHSMVGFDDETFVASSEPATTSSKRISIISNVVLVPPTPFRDETSRRQPDRRLHSSGRRVFKQEIGPKSKDHQRKVIYVEDETEMMPVEDAIKEKPKPKIGPKSKLMPTYQTTQDLLQDLTDTNPLPTLTIDESLTKETAAPPESSSKVTTPATKPRIGPKCVLLNRKQLQLPPKELLEKSVHTSSSIEPAVQKSSNVVFAMPKPKAGPKSRTRQLKSSSVDSNRNATKVTNPPKMVTITEPEPLQTAVTAHQSPQSDHSSKSPTVDEHSSNKTDKASLRRSQMVAKWTENMDTSEIPFQSCHVQTHENTSLVKCRTTSSETPTQPSDSLELSDINRSIERAQQYLPKYFATTDRNVRSIKHFWNDFLKSEFQEESSEAETQLIATPDDVELEVQSQAVLHPNQIDDNAEETRMEPQIDHTDEENVDEVRMEPQSSDDEMNVENVSSIKVEPQSPQVAQIDVKNVSYIPIEAPASVVDPHLVRCAEHSDVQQETKIKVELVECDPNETYSSDVQIIEIPPEEIIEILGDETQQLFDQLQVDRRDSEELVLPIVIPLRTSNTMSSVASSSKGFLTSLPVIASKKRNYQPLDIVVEPVQKHPPLDLLAFSQQHLTPPSYENYQIEECTMSESQHQRQDS
ncbi:uncharacterized protein LOC119078884 isoform X2 [Bradysia coprophila]|uniref:uncharacterized protein LOC119078884 isoform X2 n=1 Tax=Bradysia coprophila TaxID=38358 RepID=UPI00187D8386|nr:uncharacterized protein LOC119078884 isoform X2 [Bradysia coprophila]